MDEIAKKEMLSKVDFEGMQEIAKSVRAVDDCSCSGGYALSGAGDCSCPSGAVSKAFKQVLSINELNRD